jgi:hypothetical protein
MLRLFENRLLRKIFGLKRVGAKGSGKNYIMISLIICTSHTIFFG